jgi:tetratricopeptide (TPR) repeat protein
LNEKPPSFLSTINVAEHEGKLFFEIFFDNHKPECCMILLNNILKNRPSPQLISDLTQSAFTRQRLITSTSEYKILLSIYHKYLIRFSRNSGINSNRLVNLAIGDIYVKLGDYGTAIKYYSEDIDQFDIKVLAAISQCFSKNNQYIESINNMDKIIDSITTNIISNPGSNLNEPKLFPIPGENSYTEGKGKLALTDLFTLANKSNIKLFLVSGSLLGYAREGGILDHDKDCDLGIIGIDQLDIFLKELSSNPFFSALPNYYKYNDTFQQPIIHLPTGTWIDIFVYHAIGDKLITGVDIQFGYRQTFSFTPFNLTKVDFLGLDVYVPDDFDLNLSENFGDWKTPDKHYISHIESPSLVEKNSLIHFLSIRLWIIRSIQYKSLGKLDKLISKLKTMKDLEGSMHSDLLNKLDTISSKSLL